MRHADHETQVLIIGGGITGCGIARDLALRGVSSILVERQDINSGASGANHGLLHSGARYVRSDPCVAAECKIENDILKRLAPHCVEETGGLFAAVEGDDEKYIAEFPSACERAGIDCTPLDVGDAKEMEPVLSKQLIAAFKVNDATVDPFRLSLDNISEALELQSKLMTNTRVVGFETKKNKICRVHLENDETAREVHIKARQIINAAGAWAKEVAGLAGIEIRMVFSKGSLLITNQRIAQKVINRLRPASDADILVPGGTVSILGTTSIRIENCSRVFPTVEESNYIIDTASRMVPSLQSTRFIRAYSGIRPLLAHDPESQEGGSAVSRNFALLDHSKDGIDNFISIIGGKLTTFRLMAEKTADLVCRRLGIDRPCLTAVQPLKAFSFNQWTDPGFCTKHFLENPLCRQPLICDCEMVPRSALGTIMEGISRQGGSPNLRSISRRSRIGKGTCQGATCGLRVGAYLYDQHACSERQGLVDLKNFLAARWRGMRPILWGSALIQEELQEALHCGFLGLELENRK